MSEYTSLRTPASACAPPIPQKKEKRSGGGGTTGGIASPRTLRQWAELFVCGLRGVGVASGGGGGGLLAKKDAPCRSKKLLLDSFRAVYGDEAAAHWQQSQSFSRLSVAATAADHDCNGFVPALSLSDMATNASLAESARGVRLMEWLASSTGAGGRTGLQLVVGSTGGGKWPSPSALTLLEAAALTTCRSMALSSASRQSFEAWADRLSDSNEGDSDGGASTIVTVLGRPLGGWTLEMVALLTAESVAGQGCLAAAEELTGVVGRQQQQLHRSSGGVALAWRARVPS